MIPFNWPAQLNVRECIGKEENLGSTVLQALFSSRSVVDSSSKFNPWKAMIEGKYEWLRVPVSQANSIPRFHHSEMPLFSMAAPNSLTDSTSNSPVRSSGWTILDSIGAGLDASWKSL